MGVVLAKWVVFFILLCFAISSSWAATKNVQSQCGYTRYPSLCLESLSKLSGGNEHVDIVSVLINKTISETKLPFSNFQNLSYHFISIEAQQARMSAGYCHKLMEMSRKRLNQALLALKISPKKHKHDIQTWLSASMTFQQACKDSANPHAQSNNFMSQISKKMDYLSQLCSNSLALANRIITNMPLPKNDSKVFPSWVLDSDGKLLVKTTNTVQANVVVAKDGSGNYKTVSAAIQAAYGDRFVIYVKSGVYNEKIHTSKDGITLIGDGKYSTIIVAHGSVAGGDSLQGSATFSITGDRFIARDIGFQNTAGPEGEQAVALRLTSDHSVLYRCSIAGYQDTLYAFALRQFYRECDIYGTVDFIFGNAAAVFQNCNLVLRRPRSRIAYNVILANKRSDPGQDTGFAIQNCKITTGSDFSSVKHLYNSYLGRAWGIYSTSVIMKSAIDDAISPRGWIEWPGSTSSSLKALYFAEYANVGGGAETSRRVQWPGFHVIEKWEAEKFTVANFIYGTSWLPSTGITFDSGL